MTKYNSIKKAVLFPLVALGLGGLVGCSTTEMVQNGDETIKYSYNGIFTPEISVDRQDGSGIIFTCSNLNLYCKTDNLIKVRTRDSHSNSQIITQDSTILPDEWNRINTSFENYLKILDEAREAERESQLEIITGKPTTQNQNPVGGKQ